MVEGPLQKVLKDRRKKGSDCSFRLLLSYRFESIEDVHPVIISSNEKNRMADNVAKAIREETFQNLDYVEVKVMPSRPRKADINVYLEDSIISDDEMQDLYHVIEKGIKQTFKDNSNFAGLTRTLCRWYAYR